MLLQRAWLVRSRVLALLLSNRLQCMWRKSRVLAVLLLLPLHRLPAQQTLSQWLRRMLRIPQHCGGQSCAKGMADARYVVGNLWHVLPCDFCFQADAYTGSEHAMCTVSQVHSLQIALSRAGFSCHEEEEEWWQFGDTTFSALITFQARSLFAMDEQGQ